MSLLNLTDYNQLQFELLYQHRDCKTMKMTVKPSRKRADERASRPSPTQWKQQNSVNWESKINDEIKPCTADLIKAKINYNDALDPTAHLI